MSFSSLTARLLLFVCLASLQISFPATASGQKRPAGEYYQIQVYNFSNSGQEASLDQYLETAYLPALHKAGVKNIGVFKPIANDTATVKRIYVYIPSIRLEKLVNLPAQIEGDSVYTKKASAFLGAAYDNPPFSRKEVILLSAFRNAPFMSLPGLKGDRNQRIYELRSYEGATDKLHASKVKMFNDGSEITLFKRLDFNAVFYAEVISGSRMPNLMYMTSFENMDERNKHWDHFKNDPEWKQLSALPEYQHNVSKAEIILLHPTAYSDF